MSDKSRDKWTYPPTGDVIDLIVAVLYLFYRVLGLRKPGKLSPEEEYAQVERDYEYDER